MADKKLYPSEGNLTEADLQQIRDAIVSAYPDKDFLYIRMAGKWGIRVEDDITNVDNAPGKIVVQRIAEFASGEGRLLDLLGLAWSDKQYNPKLKALADVWLPDQPGVLAKYGVAPPPVSADLATRATVSAGLEQMVDEHSRLVGLQEFTQKLQRLSGALCRVGIPHVNGTGFLIGRRSVLTNYHVVKAADQAAKDGGEINCEFDYFSAEAPSKTLKATPGPNWLRAKSPYSVSDINGTGEPSSNELDFALITLENDVEDTRQHLPLPFAPPIVSQSDYIVIAQHPGGQTAQIALGQVVAYPGNGLRYRYNVTTEPGSSGSPVLDMDLDLVGLHHAADPALQPKYNQGVPIARIKDALEVAGVDLSEL